MAEHVIRVSEPTTLGTHEVPVVHGEGHSHRKTGPARKLTPRHKHTWIEVTHDNTITAPDGSVRTETVTYLRCSSRTCLAVKEPKRPKR